MNEHDEITELPELRDRDVEVLYDICRRASESDDAPFKALFAAYDAVLTEQGEDTAQDALLFRYLLRIGETTRAANRQREPVDLVERLRSLLDSVGITVIDEPESEYGDTTRSREVVYPSPRRPYKKSNRRVSFEDARLEETWLSEHTAPVNPPSPPPQGSQGLMGLPLRKGRNFAPAPRARSISAQKAVRTRHPAPNYSQHAPSPTGELSEAEDHNFNPTLYFEPSQTQLEQNAEAFLSTSAVRAARHTLHSWHDSAVRVQQVRKNAYSTAVAHDRRTLLKQALDQWRTSLDIKRHEQRYERHVERMEERARRVRDLFLLRKVFTHWATSCGHEQIRTSYAQKHVLRATYFRRWKAIASENQAKVRSILARKYIAVWREKTARRMLWDEQAVAHYEEALMRKYKSQWFWAFCSRRVEGWHEQWIEKRAFGLLTRSFRRHRGQNQRAEEASGSQNSRRALFALVNRARTQQGDRAVAQQHHERTIVGRCFDALRAHSRLAPLERRLQQKVDLDLTQKAFKVWHLHLTLKRQAAEVDRKRILQTAWTDWNDALRCRALAQKIDERVLVENLYRWVLQERLSLFQRTMDSKVLHRALGWWRAKVEDDRDRLADAEVVFAERQRRRRLAFGMIRLNIAMRAHEDAERAGVELANSRVLPKAFDAWKQKTDHSRRLAKWAMDARFYCLCSTTLKLWKERATEHKANRRRDAYVQIRANVKFKLVGKCFTKWRTACMEVHSMNAEGNRRAEARSMEVGSKALEHWRKRSEKYSELNAQATQTDRQKLLSSALAAVRLKRADIETMDQQALEFRNETDLALLASALRRVQWATFTATRKVESAEALWARNRDQHVKQMLRHWAAQTAARQATTTTARGEGVGEVQDDDEPDSPSLRPASRAASRSAGENPTLPSSPPTHSFLQSTPGYMRTPSRSRRAGRFRPLPTPASFTPMAFDTAYLATTPGPLAASTSQPAEVDESFVVEAGTEGLTPQVTPFSRKLRAGGFSSVAGATAPPSALKSSTFGARSVQGGTNKSVRFAGSGRFASHIKSS